MKKSNIALGIGAVGLVAAKGAMVAEKVHSNHMNEIHNNLQRMEFERSMNSHSNSILDEKELELIKQEIEKMPDIELVEDTEEIYDYDDTNNQEWNDEYVDAHYPEESTGEIMTFDDIASLFE